MGLFSKAKPARRVGLRTCGFGAKLFGSQIGGNARNGCATLALSRAVATGLQALLSRFLRRRRSWHDPNGLPLWSSAPQKGRASHTVVLAYLHEHYMNSALCGVLGSLQCQASLLGKVCFLYEETRKASLLHKHINSINRNSINSKQATVAGSWRAVEACAN